MTTGTRRDLVVYLTFDDQPYEIELKDLTGVEWRDAKRVTGGMTPGELIAASNRFDMEALAALVWVWRRREEPNLDFETVLGAITLDALTEPTATPADSDAREVGDVVPPESGERSST